MPLPHCCHLISAIELTYSSKVAIPNCILRAFKHPRLESSLRRSSSNDEVVTDALCVLEDDIVVCNRILANHGYSLTPADPCSPTDGHVLIHKLEESDRSRVKRHRAGRPLERSRYIRSSSFGNDVSTESLLEQIIEIIRVSMVYYICLFDDYSQDFESLASKLGQGSNETCRIRKNSVYEMLCAIKDCLTQLRRSGRENMEAVLITDEYSGIFTPEEVLITRSSMAFRTMLADEGIKCYSIYEDPSSSTRMNSDEENTKEDELMSVYLKGSMEKTAQDLPNSSMELAIVDLSQKASMPEQVHSSKQSFFNSLNMPIPGEDDMNLFFVRGRSSCIRLVRLLEKQCTMNLLRMKNLQLKVTPVKFVLSNFPVVFSKMQEMRVTSHDYKSESAEQQGRLSIQGLILPSVLKNIFKAVRRMQHCDIVQEVSLNVEYNVEIDSELHDPSLQISERNVLYHKIMSNMNSADHNFQPVYRVLRKMVPLRNFVIQNGRVSISSKGTLKRLGSSESVYRVKDGEGLSRAMSLNDIPRSGRYSRDTAQSNDSGVAEDIVILKDTLYNNLSSVMITAVNLEGSGTIANMSTKALVDDSLSNVYASDLASAASYPYSLKCYVELYPLRDNGEPQAVMEVTYPYQMVNLVWMMSYLLHAGCFVPFLDRESYMDNIAEQQHEQDNITNLLSLSRSYFDEFSRITDTDNFHLFNVDVSHTRNDPLAQQSYVISLVHHLRFNKRFKALFGESYQEYSKKRAQKVKSNKQKNPKSVDTKKSISVEDGRVDPLKLTSNWGSLLQRVNSDVSIGDAAEAAVMESIREPMDYVTENMNSEDADVMNYELVPQSLSNESTSRPSGFLNILRSITATDVTNLVVNSEDSFHSVSSAGRAHGRVRHCVFDFDTKVPFKSKKDRSNFQKEIEHMYASRKKEAPISAEKRHLVFVFQSSKVVTHVECTRIKLVKDIVNSSFITFTTEHDYSITSDHNDHDVGSFVRRFKSEHVASATGEYFTKPGITYSFILSVDRVERHLSRISQLFGERVMYHVYYISINHNQEEQTCLYSDRDANHGSETRYAGKNVKENFVNYSWLCDAYVNGVIDVDAEIQEIHNMRNREEPEGAGSHGKKEDIILKPTGGSSLMFREIYKETKLLWGWHIYILDGNYASINEETSEMYRKHCGIHMTSNRSIEEICKNIRDGMISHLERFKLTEEDVSSFMTQSCIYTNAVVLVGEHFARGHEIGNVWRQLEGSNRCLQPMLGGRVISFGRYKGIPLLKYSWLVSSLRNVRPEPIGDHVFQYQQTAPC